MKIEERKLFFDAIGDVNFIKNKRAKRLIIKIKPDGEVRVTVPFLMSYRSASGFVEKKKDWIIRMREDIKINNKSKTIFRENTTFETARHIVTIERHGGPDIKKIKTNGSIRLLIPFEFDIESERIQEIVRGIITEIWRQEAKSILPLRTGELASKYGFRYDKVRVKNMKTRWGSCSFRNTINLNLHLVRLPEHLCNYIILHELVHTVHKNHGKGFWAMMFELNSECRGISGELKKLKMDLW